MEASVTLLTYISILGFILGFVVSKTNFCTMGAVSDWVNIGDLSRFKSWMFAAAIAILGVTVLEYTSYINVDDSRIPVWAGLYQKLVKDLEIADQKARVGDSTLRMKATALQ